MDEWTLTLTGSVRGCIAGQHGILACKAGPVKAISWQQQSQRDVSISTAANCVIADAFSGVCRVMLMLRV